MRRKSMSGAALAALLLGCPSHPSPEARRDLPSIASDAPPVASASAAPFTPQKVTGEDSAMGTHVSFAAYTTPALDEIAVHAAFDAALAEIRRVEALMTTWRPSDLTRINDAAGKNPVTVDPETFHLIQESVHTSEISKGDFDITFESLHGLWKFDQDLDPHPPTEAQIKAKLPLVDYHHIKLDADNHTVFLDKEGVRISLGGIAKGYGVDRATAVLDKAGLTSFYVQAGGDLFTRGKKPNGDEWQTGIRDPRGPANQFFALLPVSDHAFSTAGDYERSYIVNGKRYHHIIDPHTGWPATASRSVTIYAPTALLADEIDDCVFILGPKDGMDLVESIDGVGAVIVDAHNNLWVSKRLRGKLIVSGVPTGGI
ncbi:MAG TPA: FAD:protein FMN transferase [Polyangiaceae bacterium]|jgi:thiamine biosynthesis lipoprotein